MRPWVVLLEGVARGPGGIRPSDLRAVLQALGAHPQSLHIGDRCAVQLLLEAPTQDGALSVALTRWRDALETLELSEWEVVRAEVLAPEELELEFEDEGLVGAVAALRVPPAEAGSGTGAEELIRRAFTDSLTNLENREAFGHRLDLALARSQRTGTTDAVLYLDLDDFHGINDRLGRRGGDEVMVTVAGRLTRALRPGDATARLGADEFAVLLPETSPAAAAAVAERLLCVIRTPLTLEGHDVVPSASIGMTLSRPGAASEDLLREAESAMETARTSGGASWELFDSGTHPMQMEPVRAASWLQDRLAYLLLQEAATAAERSKGLEEAAEVVLRQACKYTGWTVGRLYTVPDGEADASPEEASVWSSATTDCEGLSSPASAEASVVLGDLARRVVTSGEPQFLPELSDDRHLDASNTVDSGPRAGVAFPIRVGLEVVGALAFLSREPIEPSEPLVELFLALGSQLGRVVERQRAEENAQRLEDRWAEAEALAGLGNARTDLRTGSATWSQGLYDIVGVEPLGAEPDEGALLDAVHPDDRHLVEEDRRRVLEGRDGDSRFEVRVRRPDGETRWVLGRHSVVRRRGEPVAVRTVLHDITGPKRAEERLAESDRRWALFLENSKETLTLLSESGSILSLPEPWEAHATLPNPYRGTSFADIVHPEDAQLVREVLDRLRRTPGATLAFRARLPLGDGWSWVESIAHNLIHKPVVGAIVVNSTDISERAELEERLALVAQHDELTGLPNRSFFLDQLELALARATGSSVALYFVDIDDFRGLVSRVGEVAGEEVLTVVAERLRGATQVGASAARLGTDEFALFAEEVPGRAEAARTARQLNSLLAEPLVVGADQMRLTASIGVALGSGMQQPATLLRHAEVAMYRARRGRARFDVFGRSSTSRRSSPPGH